MTGGYAGKLIEADLTTGVVKEAALPPEAVLRQYVGCAGLGLYLLSRELRPGMRATDPDCPIVMLAGPLTGTIVPNSSNWTLVSLNSKVPYHVAISHTHGYLAPRLKHAGWDGIVVRGASPKPVYLWIDDDRVELRDAARYWGRDVLETQQLIQLDHKDNENISVACIGPGGENLIPGASVRNDKNYGASMGAPGVTWGAKKLKAIAVRGTGTVPIADSPNFVVLCDRWKKDMTAALNPPSHEAEGLLRMPLFSGWGRMPGKNFTDPVYAAQWGKALSEALPKWKVTPVGSWECEHKCHNDTYITTGPMAGATVCGYTGEVIEELGPNVGIDDPGVALALCGVVDGLGLAASEVPRTIAMVMEAYNTGRMTLKDTDGIDLIWGNYEAVIELLHKTVNREGLGAVLAKGLRPAAKELGIEDLAVHIKGSGFNDHDQRAMPFALFQSLVISGAGPTWQIASMWTGAMEPDLGWSEFKDPGSVDMDYVRSAKGKDFYQWHIKKMWDDTTGVCIFVQKGFAGALQVVPATVGAAVGWDGFDREEALLVGERMTNLQRLISLYLGYKPEHDFDISDRMLEFLPSGPAKGLGMDGELLRRWRTEFYEAAGWDPETGVPKRETLQRVGLADFEVGSSGI